MPKLHIITHPLVQDKLTLLRDKNTDSNQFRTLLGEISLLLGYEAMHDWPSTTKAVQTPLKVITNGSMIDSHNVALISVLRAGNGMLDGLLKLVPTACVGHLGLYRDPKSMSVIEYYCKMPAEMDQKHVIVLDPLVATGHSAAVTISRIQDYNPKSIIFICLIASKEGVAYLKEQHPHISIFTAAVDPDLDARHYISPGVGDAGDRMYGTT
jgi:uracil phosphoribosyltransferase